MLTLPFGRKGVNKIGPSLFGVVDQPAASLTSYRYSDRMMNFGKNGGKWDEANLKIFLKAPRDLVPGTAMAFAGLKKPVDIEDVIEYLRATNARQ